MRLEQVDEAAALVGEGLLAHVLVSVGVLVVLVGVVVSGNGFENNFENNRRLCA